MSRFTFDTNRDLFPVWSPNGDRIVFDSNRTGHRDLYENRASGGAELVLLHSDQDKVVNSWGKDGRFIFYTTINEQANGDLWVLHWRPGESRGLS